MKTLHLDSSFRPLEGDDVLFESFIFHGGEPHIKIKSTINEGDEVFISTRLISFTALGTLCLAVDALRRMGVAKLKCCIPYFPAARQDRVMVPGEPLSVKVYADIINQLKFDAVYVYDPHSEVTPALLHNCHVITNHTFIQEVIAAIPEPCILISPDGGALKKIYKVAAALGGVDVVECSKSRDVATGALSGFKVYADDLNGKACLIVDDICDGGGTFLGLAQALKDKNAGNIYLAVSHGIFNKGFDELNAHFTKIFTTNSFRDFDDPSLYQYSIKI
jgi:ribose-phosphate pyrophosphokinase